MECRVKKKIALLCVLFLCVCPAAERAWPMRAQAAQKELTVSMARSLALSESSTYKKLQNKLTLARVQYVQAVKAIRLKEKNQRTFRWTPLFSFKFPESPTESEQFEYIYKPLELQSQIDALNHQVGDTKYEVYKTVSQLFVDLYVLQEKIAFGEEQISKYEDTLERNKARLLLGEANQSDIDAMEKKLSTLRSAYTSNRRNFEAKKQKLSSQIGIDVSTSYQFASPFVGASLDRDKLNELIAYTLEHDDAYYQTCVEEANGRLALTTNYSLMKKKYGSDMDMVDSYINQAKRGQKFDSSAFRLQYDALLAKVDEPWNGKYKFLFIKIPKEWFKGATSGVRYVEDEPYILYEAAVDYQGLYQEKEMAKNELIESVKDAYENYVAAKNVYEGLERDLKNKEKELERAGMLNSTGKMTYEEYSQVQEEYEGLQTDKLDAQAAYSTILYEFDRLACGAVGKYMTGAAISMDTAQSGQSYVVKDQGEGVYYYIHSLVSDNLFEFGLSVPQDFAISLTDYELWVDGVQVGSRTAIDKTIRHLELDIDQVGEAFVRLYDGDSFVDDCAFDASVYSDRLTITTGYRVEKEEETKVAAYVASTDQDTGLFTLTVIPEPGSGIAYYNIKTQAGDYLVSDEKRSVKETFRYLPIAEGSLDTLTICFYGEDQELLYEATFHTEDLTIHKRE